jgi:LacI family transcriptional regulator
LQVSDVKERVTSYDVAKRAGVSRSVVSAVLNNTPGIGFSEEKRKAVLKAIKELNYHVDAHARGMRTGRSHCLAAYDNLGNKFFLQMLSGIKRACKEAGYHMLIYGSGSAENDRDGLIELFLQRRIDGIITKDSTSFSDAKWAEEIRSMGIPYISVEGYPEDDQVVSVLMDYEQSIRMALQFLHDRELPPPVYVEIYTPPVYKPNWGDQRRRHAYEEWMKERGLVPQIISRPHNKSERLDAWWLNWLGSQRLPVTVLANWSTGAREIYRAAYQLGLKIGVDVFVMAADNTEEVNEYLIPSLSAVEVPYMEMGQAAAERLLEYIRGDRDLSDTSKIYLQPRLAVRESTGTPKSPQYEKQKSDASSEMERLRF